MLSIICDENIPYSYTEILKKLWYKVIHIGKDFSGITDMEVLDMVFHHKAILITNDKDFGMLSYSFPKKNRKSIVLILVRDVTQKNRIIEFIKSKKCVCGTFAVIDSDKTRIRKFSK